MRSYRVLAGVLVLAFVGGFGAMKAEAIDLGSIVKVGGIGFLVQRFGPQINSFINGLMGKHKISAYEATKVVPIISLGNGGYIGAARVQGPQHAVDSVKAVAQIEGNFSGNTFRVKVLIPVNSINPTDIKRVTGTGVSAIIDVHI